MEQAAAEWRYDQRHKDAQFHDGTFPTDRRLWAKERSAKHPYHYRDGVTLWVAETDVSPHDHFLGGAEDCAECNPGTRPDDEEVTSGDSP